MRKFSSEIKETKVMCDRFKVMDVHQVLRVFRKYLGSCSFNYLLRRCRAFSLSGYLKGVDEVFRSTLEAISNVRL